MEEYKILKDLIKFNTIKDKENKEILDYIESYLLKIGFETEKKDKNLIMSIGKDFKFGFLGHTDTVEYIEGWDTNPFELTKIDDELYGLGVCDMKGGIAAILEAVSLIDFNKLNYGMKLYFTYDEEIGFGGIYDIVKTNETFPEIMIFGEPTNNEILLGSKGLLEYELCFNGIKAHSSNPEKGKSANMNAVKFLFELEDAQAIESVLMKYKYGYTLCVSTQVGCRMGCKFCASTLNGRVRDLTAGEMLSTIAVVNADNGKRTERNFSNIVLMGMGEPLDNYDNVLRFLELVNLLLHISTDSAHFLILFIMVRKAFIFSTNPTFSSNSVRYCSACFIAS